MTWIKTVWNFFGSLIQKQSTNIINTVEILRTTSPYAKAYLVGLLYGINHPLVNPLMLGTDPYRDGAIDLTKPLVKAVSNYMQNVSVTEEDDE